MYNILVCDDEKDIVSALRIYLTAEGYNVLEAFSGAEALEILDEKKVDLVLMDIMMPELDGFSACREIRKMRDVPVLMLSARGEEYDRIHGFEAGGDDYVVKPFSPRELMLRIDAILRRAGSAAKPDEAQGQDGHEVLQIGGLCIDFSARLVYVDGERRNMSPKEYELLFYLVQNRGRALTREKIITEIWGYDYYGDDRTLDTHIKLLRKSLGKYAACIVTLRGVGYRFEAKEDLEERKNIN